MKRIVLGFEGNRGDDAAAAHLLMRLRFADAVVHTVHVVEPAPLAPPSGPNTSTRFAHSRLVPHNPR